MLEEFIFSKPAEICRNLFLVLSPLKKDGTSQGLLTEGNYIPLKY